MSPDPKPTAELLLEKEEAVEVQIDAIEELEEEMPEILEELVIEEVSIDGMCGVY